MTELEAFSRVLNEMVTATIIVGIAVLLTAYWMF